MTADEVRSAGRKRVAEVLRLADLHERAMRTVEETTRAQGLPLTVDLVLPFED